MPEPTILFTRKGTTGILRLNRPQVENAIDGQTMAALEQHLDAIEAAHDVRVLILTATGTKTFCAGGDLSYFATLRPRAAGVAMSERMQAILGRLANGPRPVIAAVNGNAWGGGGEILTACHLRLATEHARFGFRQAAMGVVPGWGGGARLFRQVGRSHALRLLLTADTIDASEALRIGLINSVVSMDGLMAEALDLAARIACNPPNAIAAMLDLAQTIETGDSTVNHTKITARETELFGDCWEREYFQAKLTAWSARRPTS